MSAQTDRRAIERDDSLQRSSAVQMAPPLAVFGCAAEERAAALYLLFPLVCELHDRYAPLQGRIRAAWWERDAEIELLAALCAQRALLDARAHDPLSAGDQISFLLHLPVIADQLTQSHGHGCFDPTRDHQIFLEALRELAASEQSDRCERC